MCCVTEAGSYLRRIHSCITQLKAQGPSRVKKKKKDEEGSVQVEGSGASEGARHAPNHLFQHLDPGCAQRIQLRGKRSMNLKYEPASEPLHITRPRHAGVQDRERRQRVAPRSKPLRTHRLGLTAYPWFWFSPPPNDPIRPMSTDSRIAPARTARSGRDCTPHSFPCALSAGEDEMEGTNAVRCAEGAAAPSLSANIARPAAAAHTRATLCTPILRIEGVVVCWWKEDSLWMSVIIDHQMC